MEIFIVINVVAFLIMGLDKFKARKGLWRISEATLLLLALFMGAVGVWVGMYVFRHKTQHKLFRFALPIMVIINIVLLILGLEYINYK